MKDKEPIPIRIFYSEEDGGFIAVADHCPGCSAYGDTVQETLRELADALDAWNEAWHETSTD